MLLSQTPTLAPEHLRNKDARDDIERQTQDLRRRLGELQAVLFAEAQRSLLIILQGMDASGKDGAVKSVFTGVNPMGCRAIAFKVPTAEEAAHDFLWRVHPHAPARGMIQIFNRSHYEDILVPTVHNLLPKSRIDARYDAINAFEQLLADNGTLIFKFYLHISRREQQERFAERTSNPEKRWKYQEADFRESEHWDDYMAVYERLFERCGPQFPWHIVPADQRWYRDYVILSTLVPALEALDLQYPKFIKQ